MLPTDEMKSSSSSLLDNREEVTALHITNSGCSILLCWRVSLYCTAPLTDELRSEWFMLSLYRKYRKELGPNMESKQTFIMKRGSGTVIPVSIAF